MKIRDLRVIWEVGKIQAEPYRRMLRDIVRGLWMIVVSVRHIREVPFWFRLLWRSSANDADRWYRCQICGRLWHIHFLGGQFTLPLEGDARRTHGCCRWCREK